MGVYWRSVKLGRDLILSNESDAQEPVIREFRGTKRSIDAYATIFGYDPGRSQKEFASTDDAKAFVEHFRPCELYGAQDISVGLKVRPFLDAG